MANIKVPTNVEFILDTLLLAGYDAYIVGGCVRDTLLNKAPHDWDICTSARPEEVKYVFCYLKSIDTGIKHGTVTILLDDCQYEITTFREDGKYSDNRHPDSVSFVSNIVSDLSRRDFTVNALAYNTKTGLVDLFDGKKDIKNEIIRCVGSADERFNEDALRILRAIRFSSVLGFKIAPDTRDSIHRNKSLLDNVASERIQSELKKLLLGEGVLDVLIEYADIIAQIIPEVQPCIGFEQRNPYHYLQVWEHTVHAVAASPQNIIVRLAMLLHDIGKPSSFVIGGDGVGHYYGHPEVSAEIAYCILRDLKFDNDTTNSVVELVKYHDADIAPAARSIRRWLNRIGEERIRQLLEVKKADALAQVKPEIKLKKIRDIEEKLNEIIEQSQCFSFKDLTINGNDVLGLGITEGRMVGAILRSVLDAVIDGVLDNNRDAIFEFIKTIHITSLLLSEKEINV